VESGDQNGAMGGEPSPIADLHCHYPMHVVAEAKGRRFGLKDKLRGRAIRRVARAANHEDYNGSWRVRFAGLKEADVRLVLSVLYSPFGELDLGDLFQPDPEHSYFEALVKQLDAVEEELRSAHDSDVLVVTTPGELDEVVHGDRVGICHAVEGGFHLGRDPEAVEARVAELARRGVAYITLAHLIPHRVAASTPALPFLPDHAYDRFFPQRTEGPLSAVGEAAVRAMYRQGVLIDVSHMHEGSIEAVFALLRELDRGPGKRNPIAYPVIASHAGYRFGSQHYMLSPRTIRLIAARQGVVGLIMARHQLNDGRNILDPESTQETVATLLAHRDAIHRQAGREDIVAIGSDLDGFINPTVAGVARIEDLARLRRDIEAEIGPAAAAGFFSGNALRVLRKAYEGRR
jgi:microsomal dipeptidase-like Zn-dependent dipeptidase